MSRSLVRPSATDIDLINSILTFYPAVFAAAWMAGLRGGLAAGLLSTVLARHFFIQPDDSLFVARAEDRIAEVIFDRFRQAESGTTRSFSGLGLGLSIARSLVEAHGARIEAFSGGLGKGATFRVTLPTVAHPPDQPSPAAAAGAEARTTPLAGGRRLDDARVLVVEDDSDGANCYSLIRRVRVSQDGRQRVPAIALTAYARPEDREHTTHLDCPTTHESRAAVVYQSDDTSTSWANVRTRTTPSAQRVQSSSTRRGRVQEARSRAARLG